jgi:hypothetical protein
VRTTVRIDDDVLRDAKERAAKEGRTLGELVTEALRERLSRRQRRAGGRYRAVTSGEAGPIPGVDVTNNAAMRDLSDGQ